jgi:phosphoribosylformylglycinamidine cyclo-ligase
MIVIVSPQQADAALAQLRAAGETVTRIGEIRAREGDEHQTIVV